MLADVDKDLDAMRLKVSDAHSKLSGLIHGRSAVIAKYSVTSQVSESDSITSATQTNSFDVVEATSAREAKWKTRTELESKENVDPVTRKITMAPKKKHTAVNKNSTCRIGNMIVKRNSWNLAFEPLQPVLQEQRKPLMRAKNPSSVYDFD